MSDQAVQALDICIDTASWQGVVDWPRVYANGIRIAFIKAMEGANPHYPSWKPQSEGARRAGLVVIPYLYLRPENPKAVVAAFAQVTDLWPGMAFALDWEGRASQTATAAQAEEIGEELGLIAGRKPIGYWGLPGSTPSAPTERMMEWPRWVPRYPRIGATAWEALPAGIRDAPAFYWFGRSGSAGGLPVFAQYTAWGRVPGVTGDVDRSVAFFPTVDDALTWCLGSADPAPPEPEPDRIDTTIRAMQAALVSGGWYAVNTAGQVDGRFGPKSEAAMSALLDAYDRRPR
jgi:lysozyme